MPKPSLPKIRIVAIPGGHRVHCLACGPELTLIRASRPAADLAARDHQNEHAGAPDALERLLRAHDNTSGDAA